MEKIKENNEVLERIGAKRSLLNDILGGKVSWIGNVLGRNCLLHDATEAQITEVRGVKT